MPARGARRRASPSPGVLWRTIRNPKRVWHHTIPMDRAVRASSKLPSKTIRPVDAEYPAVGGFKNPRRETIRGARGLIANRLDRQTGVAAQLATSYREQADCDERIELLTA